MQHVDACVHMLRRRRHFYPDTYTQKGTILSTFLVSIIHGAWKSHKGARTNFRWGDDILGYCRGVEDEFYPRWGECDFLYFVLNLPKHGHWVTCEVDIELWKITVYDCDSSVCPQKDLASIMKTWEELLPSLLHACGEFPNNNQTLAVDLNECSQLPKMHFTRASHELVPKAKIR